MDVVLVYLVIVNAAGFVLMLVDKQKAIRGAWRIPEKTFFSLAVAGGSMGCIAGMYTFRHKTKHKAFTVGMPAILLLQFVAVLLYWGS